MSAQAQIPNLLFVADLDLWLFRVPPSDLRTDEVERDNNRSGYWIKPNTQTHSQLLLRGVKVKRITPSLSEVLGHWRI